MKFFLMIQFFILFYYSYLTLMQQIALKKRKTAKSYSNILLFCHNNDRYMIQFFCFILKLGKLGSKFLDLYKNQCPLINIV